MKFRLLTADDIEVRVQSVKPNGVILLLYKNARVDMNILDDEVGAENWQREHYECKGNLFCRVGIKCDTASDEWIWKSDCGTESNTEAQKGEASDSFKRACFNWGIGRELYTSPFIWVGSDKCKIENGKCFDRFSVEKILYSEDGKRITGLSIWNDSRKVQAFSWEDGKRDIETPKAPILCAACGAEITPVTLKSGGTWTAENVATFSIKNFGRILCPACQKRVRESTEAGDYAENL